MEIHYQAFANSGSLTLWLNDAQKQSLTFIDNDTRALTDARLGAQGVDTNTNGTLYFDDFESRRFSYIGTLPDPGVNDPQATNQPGWFARTYQYSATIPHAVTNVTPETGTPDTYSYDANGNMICRIENGVTYSQAYNAENRISSIAKRTGDCATGTILESWSFAYDGDGVRVSTAHFTGASGTPDSTTSYYMGGQYEVKDGATKKYYSIAGMMVAVNDGTGLQYLLTDHLGSTVAVTNSSGTLTSQQRYLPFGAPRTIPNSPILGTDFTYTGQRKLDDGMGGVMDYKARFYSPALGRFQQPDTIIPDQSNPQSFNRYGYVLNNPIRFNDPSGHVCEDPEKGEGARCFGSPLLQTRVGDRMVRGNGAELGKAKNLRPGPDYDWFENFESISVDDRGPACPINHPNCGLGLNLCGQGLMVDCPPEQMDEFDLTGIPQTMTLHIFDANNKEFSKIPIYDYSTTPPTLIGYRITSYVVGDFNRINVRSFLPIFGDSAMGNIDATYFWGKILLKPGLDNLASVGVSFACAACGIGFSFVVGAYALNDSITYNGILLTHDVYFSEPLRFLPSLHVKLP